METLALVLTDVEGSTRLWQDEPEAMDAAMQRHHLVVHDAVAAHGGWCPRDQGEGDAVFAAFPSAAAAVDCAVDVQRRLAGETWPTSGALRVRIGIHVGEVIERGGNLFGEPVNRCARLRGLGSGGQTLISSPVYELIRQRMPDSISCLDLGLHRMKDLSRPEQVWQVDVAGLPCEFPPLASLNRAHHNLPVQISSFVGRSEEVADIRKLVAAHRLVTITGFGGTGKTRVALQVAAELAEGDGDGVWFVDMSGSVSAEELPSAIARVLGVSDNGEGIAAAVREWLATKRLLLVLDNLEHIIDCAAFVLELVTDAPQLRILATSREPLRIPGEHDYPLSALPIDASENGSAYARSDAMQLFADRAAEVRPDFVLSPDNSTAVKAICQRLEGHPLSIELAAARTNLLPPSALLDRLGSLSLTSSGRGRPDRQRTLRATIDWSYQLLSSEERSLLDALSVFPGTASLDAIAAICGPDIDNKNVVEVLMGLVDKSLVRVNEPTADDPETRVSLLQSIRGYALERLAAAGRDHNLAERHAAHYARELRLVPDQTHEQTQEWCRRVTLEQHNLRAALSFFRREGNSRAHAECAAALANAANTWGHFSDAFDIAQEVLSWEADPSEAVALLLHEITVAHFFAARPAEARAAAREMLEMARTLNLPHLRAIAATDLLWNPDAAELSEVLSEAEDAVAMLPATGNIPSKPDIESQFRMAVHHSFMYLDPPRSRAMAERLCLDGVQLDKDSPFEAARMFAISLANEGEYERAREVLCPAEQAIWGHDEPDDDHDARISSYFLPGYLKAFGWLYLGLGDTARALRIAQETADAAIAAENDLCLHGSFLIAAECHVRDGDIQAAHDVLTSALSAALPTGNPALIGAIRWRMARLTRLRGNHDEAMDLIDAALRDLDGRQIRALPDVMGAWVEKAVQVSESDPVLAAELTDRVAGVRRNLVLPMDLEPDFERLQQTQRLSTSTN